jgi:hypothetical protein
LSNCWNPSTRVAKLAEIFDVEALRAWIVRLLSSSVFKRNENWPEVSGEERWGDSGARLCFFLQIENIDFLDLALLVSHQHRSPWKPTLAQTSLKKKTSLFARRAILGSTIP